MMFTRSDHRDAVALLEATYRRDEEAARVILRNCTPQGLVGSLVTIALTTIAMSTDPLEYLAYLRDNTDYLIDADQ